MLYDGFATRGSVRQQRSLLDAATSRLASQQNTTGLRAVEVYLELLRRQELVRLAQLNLDQHVSTLEKIQERFESGVGTRVDVVQTQAHLRTVCSHKALPPLPEDHPLELCQLLL